MCALVHISLIRVAFRSQSGAKKLSGFVVVTSGNGCAVAF